jgi:hypothetical protein
MLFRNKHNNDLIKMRVYLPTIESMNVIYNMLYQYNPKMDVNNRKIKFIKNDKKYCVLFSSHRDEIININFIKRITIFVNSSKQYRWIYDKDHPYIRRSDTPQYIASCIIKNI